MTKDRFWPTLLIVTAIALAALTAATATAIVHFRFSDPDDVMRLLEVRDWLGGQSWWDVNQHRLAGTGGFQMHWSRIVDIPLAGTILLLQPLLGGVIAERAAIVLVPLATLAIVIVLAALLTRRLLDAEHAVYAAWIVPLSVPLLYQLRPMRIDHHGWQVAFSLLAALALLWPDRRKSGLVAGAALATLVSISLEGLPFAALAMGVAALGWAVDARERERERERVRTLAATFAVGSLLLFVATRDPALRWIETCDAVAPGYLAGAGIAAGGIALATMLPLGRVSQRLAALAVIGAGAIAVLLAIAPGCAHGPFASLPPLVRALWYENVSEGLPMWRQSLENIALGLALPLIGLAGSAAAWRETMPGDRRDWTTVLLLLLGATAIAMLVARAGAVANALAVPGSAYLAHPLLRKARALRAVPARIAATVGVMALGAPCIVVIFTNFYLSRAASAETPSRNAGITTGCDEDCDLRALAALPSGTILAPLELSPDILRVTPDRAVASGYHRNGAAMADVLTAFTGSPQVARAIVERRHIDYIVGRRDLNEVAMYKHVAPGGFWARLERGERFDWLTRVSMPGSPLMLWRVAGPPLTGPNRPLSETAPKP